MSNRGAYNLKVFVLKFEICCMVSTEKGNEKQKVIDLGTSRWIP